MKWNWPFGNTPREAKTAWPLALLSGIAFVEAVRLSGDAGINPFSELWVQWWMRVAGVTAWTFRGRKGQARIVGRYTNVWFSLVQVTLRSVR
jgi:hypothetical protein